MKEKEKTSRGESKNRTNNVFLLISVLIASVFLLSPFLLRSELFFGAIDWFLEPLIYSEYKEAFIGASGGMIGSFLAITGALWVERKLSSDNEKKESEKVALILFYDINLFYKEVSSLATNIAWILGIRSENEKKEKYILYKNSVGIHIHPDWISLVASLRGVLKEDEIEKIYTFYGYVSDMKRLIEKDNLDAGNMGRVNSIIHKLGNTKDGYFPNKEYSDILDHLKQIAK